MEAFIIKGLYVHFGKAGPKRAPIGSQIEFRSSNKSPSEWSSSCQKCLSAAQEPPVHCAGSQYQYEYISDAGR